MGRIAGVTAEETRRRLLDAAAGVFARRGYDGASIAEITSEAGLSSGSVYTHFAGKADLFVATLRVHADAEVERLVGEDGPLELVSFLAARGATLDRRAPEERPLLAEAVVAAGRHPEVAEVLRSSIADREAVLAGLLRAAQAAGEIDGGVAPEAAARFALTVALGSMVSGALGLRPVGHDDWAALVGRLVDSVRTHDRREAAT